MNIFSIYYDDSWMSQKDGDYSVVVWFVDDKGRKFGLASYDSELSWTTPTGKIVSSFDNAYKSLIDYHCEVYKAATEK